MSKSRKHSKTLKKKIHPIIRLFEPVVDAIAGTFGKSCEVVLHDFSDPEHSIVKIVNGHITGRKIGDPITDLGLKALKSNPPLRDYYLSYITEGKNGRSIKSSSILIRDINEKIIGGLCINIDLSNYEAIIEVLQQMCNISSEGQEIQEMFENDVAKLVDNAVKEVVQRRGRSLMRMNPPEKQEVVKELEAKGIFLIKGAVGQVANALGISRPSVYKYLYNIRK